MFRFLPAVFLVLSVSFVSRAQSVKVLTNHIGYEENKTKHAVILSDKKISLNHFELIDEADGKVAYTGKAIFSGAVDKWKNWLFWTADFSKFTKAGNYKLQVSMDGRSVSSFPFVIGKSVLEQSTISDLLYYFKGQRSSGLLDAADHHLQLAGKTGKAVDAHGGWYDASGDYGKHLSHLSFSSYFNPQQISLTAWSLLKTYDRLLKKSGTDYRQYNRRILDEAMYGADYLVRMQVGGGSFYRSVSAPGPGKFAKDRVIRAEDKSYRIKQTKEQSFGGNSGDTASKSYQVSFRSGGGMAIAALAMASSYDTSGDFTNKDYLAAAESAFAFLSVNNVMMTNDGKENIVDDYCALNAATELFRATKKDYYRQYAEQRAFQLINRLYSEGPQKDYWRANDKDRPFFHPSDAGLPVISLINYFPFASPANQSLIRDAVKRSLVHELSITHAVNNPFGYSRQYTEDTIGQRKAAFFFPHGSEASPWWQGENARLGSMAAAARLGAQLFNDNKPFADSLDAFALDQLNWILGLNPYDACMLEGKGHNNPQYGFFGTFEYTNAPGGIVNGITSGLENEADIDFNLSYALTKKDNDWRWAEQWLPHAAWYLFAVAVSN